MTPQRLNLTVLFVLITLSMGCTAAQELAKGDSVRTQAAEQDYRIGPEDLLYISVWKNESLSRTMPVRPDGKISLPLLNDVQAAGLTPMQLQNMLTNRLSEYIASPEVSVIVQEVRSQKVSVIGEVKTPGRYPISNSTTVVDVLAQAGGFSDFASPSRIVVLRTDGEAVKRIPFNYDKVVSARMRSENLYLQPGDVVVVP